MAKSFFRAVVCACVAAATACSGGNGAKSAPASASVNATAPNFTEPTAAGSSLSLASLRGKAVYLNFFASWCPPCNEEASDINALQREHGAQGLQVVGVDVLENRAKAASFVSKHGLTYPAVVDDGTLRDAYDVNGLPVHVFIDRQGIVRNIIVGEMTRGEMEANVKKIL
jgi:cytochrome c biogenesis protein CcmG/thiol:disulfide interchange protein DsbE